MIEVNTKITVKTNNDSDFSLLKTVLGEISLLDEEWSISSLNKKTRTIELLKTAVSEKQVRELVDTLDSIGHELQKMKKGDFNFELEGFSYYPQKDEENFFKYTRVPGYLTFQESGRYRIIKTDEFSYEAFKDEVFTLMNDASMLPSEDEYYNASACFVNYNSVFLDAVPPMNNRKTLR